MELRTLINNISIQDIFNRQLNRMTSLFANNDKFDRSYYSNIVNYLVEDLNQYLATYQDLDLRSESLDFNVALLTSILRNNFFNWVLTYKNQFESMIKNLGTSQEIKSVHSDGYTGFSVDNQDGDFSKRKGDTSMDTASNMTILAFLQEFEGNLFEKIWKEIANKMLVVIY